MKNLNLCSLKWWIKKKSASRITGYVVFVVVVFSPTLCPSVCLSICSLVDVSDFVWMISSEPLNHFKPKLGMVVYYYEVECHVQKLVHYLQCQGHSKGLYKQNMTFFFFTKSSGLFATKLYLIVHHHKLECPVEKCGYCIQGQHHSEDSKCKWMFV